MTKTQIIEMLKELPGDAEIVLWTWNERAGKGKVTFLNPASTQKDGGLFILIDTHIELRQPTNYQEGKKECYP